MFYLYPLVSKHQLNITLIQKKKKKKEEKEDEEGKSNGQKNEMTFWALT